MDDLKNIVIQNLEQEGTLGSLRAQLRAQVFKAIENYADNNTKQSAGFQWENPQAGKIHEDPDSKLMALLIKEYLEHYKMDYTLSVYLPEIAMQRQEHQMARDELAERSGLAAGKPASTEKPLLVQLLQQMRQQPTGAASSNASPVRGAQAAAAAQAEESKQVSTAKSPFRSSNQVSASAGAAGQEPQTKGSPNAEDDIEEDIVQDHEDIMLQQNSARDAIAASGGASSAVGIDQSIDTLRLEEFDWVEDVKHTPRGEI